MTELLLYSFSDDIVMNTLNTDVPIREFMVRGLPNGSDMLQLSRRDLSHSPSFRGTLNNKTLNATLDYITNDYVLCKKSYRQ